MESLESDEDDEDLIAMSHVCQTWREISTSRSPLWSNFNCTIADKTRVYLERSKSAPINIWLDRDYVLPPSDPLLQVIPHNVGRLKSFSMAAKPAILPDIIAHLPPDAPLLERLEIDCSIRSTTSHDPTLTDTLFNGNLSSLRVFRLERVCTGLPWRNMVNLTLFVLGSMSPDSPSVGQLLDFFESAPRLRKISLASTTSTTGGESGRLASLACLKRMEIRFASPSPHLLSHLVIPVGAKLTAVGNSFRRITKDLLPRSLDNLRNISNFTKIHLRITDRARITLSGPSGQFSMASSVASAPSGFEALVRLDTSKVERLEVVGSKHPSALPSYQGLLPLKSLRTLTLSRCRNPFTFMAVLSPNMDTSGVVVCPKLEEIVVVLDSDTEEIDVESTTEIAAARASRGAKLRTLKIVGKLNLGDVLELKKHVSNVECDLVVDVIESDSDDSDEDSWW